MQLPAGGLHGRGIIARDRRRTAAVQQRRHRGVGIFFLPAQLLAQQAQLAMQFAPLAHAQEAQEMAPAPVAQLRLGQVFMGLPIGIPQAQHADELGAAIGELRVRGVGGAARVGRSLARILDTQERRDHQHRPQAAGGLRGHQHAGQFHVHRQPCHLPADRGQAALAVDRAQLGQLLPAIGDGALVGRLQERKVLDPAQAQLQHAQDHPGQAGAADLRIGELRARLEIGFAVQAVADAFGHAPAAALALVGAGLRDGLDMQAVELVARAVALDAGEARIDHVADARHGQRGLGHVGGQHDAPVRPRVEHAVLVLVGQARVQRQHLGIAVLAALQRLVRVADLALAGQEDQHVAACVQPGDLVDGADDGLVDGAFACLFALAFQRAVAHLDRIGAAFHADHRRVVEMLREAFGIDGGRGDDDLQVAALAQQLLQVTQQEVDVEAALVRFVDDDRVVGRQPAVAGDFRQQDAVGHELDVGVLAHLVVEAHLEAHATAQLGLQFLGHASRHRAGGDAPRLGAADHAGHAAPGGQAQLGQLGGLARSGFAGNHHHLVIADQLDDAIALARDRQGCIQRHRRHRRQTALAGGDRRVQCLLEGLPRAGIGRLALPARPQPVKAAAVAAQRAVERAPALFEGGAVGMGGGRVTGDVHSSASG